jgi:hypothetical protein
MLTTIPLTDDERAAVEDGQLALEHLIKQLTNMPTPAGATPQQIGIPPTATPLPLRAITPDVLTRQIRSDSTEPPSRQR